MAYEYLNNVIENSVCSEQFGTFKGFNSGNTYKVFWHQITAGVLYQTGAGQKGINWNIESFTNADQILNPFQPLFVCIAGKDADNLAVNITEKYQDDDKTKPIIGYQKITNPANCKYSNAKILFDDRGLKVAPNVQKFTQITAQRTLRVQIKDLLDYSQQSQYFFTVPEIEENYYLYAIDIKPIYSIDNKFQFTELTLVSTADIFNQGGGRLSDFIRDSGVGDLTFFPIINADGDIVWDEKRWNINPLTKQPIGANSYNSQLGIDGISGQAGFEGDLIIGCDFSWDEEKHIMTYGVPKILVQRQPLPTYSNELSANALASDTFLVVEGCGYASDVFWNSFQEKQKSNADLSATPTYQGDFITDGDSVINSNTSFKSFWDSTWDIQLGVPFSVNANKQSWAVSIAANGEANFIQQTADLKGFYKWNTEPNFLFYTGSFGAKTFDWFGTPPTDIATWYFMNTCLANTIPIIPIMYRNIVKWSVKEIPIIGPIIDWFSGGLLPSWADIKSGGYGAQPTGFLCSFDIMYFALKSFYPKGDGTENANYGTVPMSFFDNTADGYKIPGQQASTSIAFRLTDSINIKPTSMIDGTLLPTETIDTNLLARTTILDSKYDKFYGLGKDGNNLNWSSNETPKDANGDYKSWVILSANSKHIGMTNWQLSFAYIKNDNKNISSDNIVWQGTYQTMPLFRSSIRDHDIVLPLMNFNNTNAKPITNLSPILYPSQGESTSFNFEVNTGTQNGEEKGFRINATGSSRPYDLFIFYFNTTEPQSANPTTQWPGGNFPTWSLKGITKSKIDDAKDVRIVWQHFSITYFYPWISKVDVSKSYNFVKQNTVIPYDKTTKTFSLEVETKAPDWMDGKLKPTTIAGEAAGTWNLVSNGTILLSGKVVENAEGTYDIDFYIDSNSLGARGGLRYVYDSMGPAVPLADGYTLVDTLWDTRIPQLVVSE